MIVLSWTLALVACATQKAVDLPTVLKQAEAQNKLVAVLVGDNDAPSRLMRESFDRVSKSEPQLLWWTETGTNEKVTWRGFDIPRHPTVFVLDKDGSVMGHLVGPVDQDFLKHHLQQVVEAWKKHDGLVFRSKARLNESDRWKLALSYACRLEPDRAAALLAETESGRTIKTEEARFAIAEAYWILRQPGKAQDHWQKLRSNRVDEPYRSHATVNYAVLLAESKREEALRIVREVAEDPNAPTSARWLADHYLKKWEQLP